MTHTTIIIFIAWIIGAVIDYAEFVYLWQLKEYRWDKFRDFLQTKQGKTYWFRTSLWWRLLLLIAIVAVPTNSASFFHAAVLGFLVADAALQIRRYLTKQTHRPATTTKALLLVALSLLLEGLIIMTAGDWTILFLVCVLRFFIVTTAVIFIWLPTQCIKRAIVLLATWKIRRYKNITVIGVTGSFGKTTVKEFLAYILGGSMRVIRTPEHVNTEIGVAKFILKTNFDAADIFVVEMGAYRNNEIAVIAKMVRPTIGILTAINEQHLSLFGSIEAIQKTKYELLRALPRTGLAVTNADNRYCTELLHTLSCRTTLFGYDAEQSPALLVEDVHEKQDHLTFDFTFQSTSYHMQAPLHGVHNALNLAPCILVASSLGMSMEAIEARIATIPQPKRALELLTYGNAYIIDDTYNSNPNGFRAALDYMGTFPSTRKRIVITRGMLELGEKSEQLHEHIAGEISFRADELVLISTDEVRAIQRGLVGTKYHTEFHIITDREEIEQFITSQKDKEVVILLENRLPDDIYRRLRAAAKSTHTSL